MPKKSGNQEDLIPDDSSVYRSAGRSLLTPSFFQVLDEIEDALREQNKELDDVPVVREMIDRDLNVEGITIEDRLLDVGHFDGMAEAWCRHAPTST